LSANVTVGGGGTAPTISVGDSGKAGLLAITGNYTQLSTAAMNIFIGGTTVGTQYSQLQVSGTATLAGTLTVTLASGFTPALKSTFTVLTAGTVTNTFSNSTIAINSSEHFVVSYTSTSVLLTVVSGAAPQSGSLPKGSLAALRQLKQQPLTLSGLRYRVGMRPRTYGKFFTVGVPVRERSGAVMGGRHGLSAYGAWNGVPIQAVTWDRKAIAVNPAAELRLNPTRISPSARELRNSNGLERGVTLAHLPAAAMPTERLPVRNLQPTLPRVGR
jgi:hypothetical protein